MSDLKGQVWNYLKNLDREGLIIISTQLLLHPESRDVLLSCVTEFDKFYNYKKFFGEKEVGD